MSVSFDVRVWELRKVKRQNRAVRYEVRWTVDGFEKSKSFQHKAQADSFRAMLLSAAKNGDAFDPSTGQPAGTVRGAGPSCFEVAVEMVAAKWPTAAAKSRSTEVDNLAYLLCALVKRPGAASVRLSARSNLAPGSTPTPSESNDLRWLAGASVPISEVDAELVRKTLEAVSKRQDGKPLSASVQSQRRTYLSGLMAFAVEKKYISENPVAQVKAKRAGKVTVRPVTPLEVGDLVTARRIINAMDDGVYKDFVLTVLLAGVRPSEAAALQVSECVLPDKGWGELRLSKSAAAAGRAWTDSGEHRDERGLKHRAAGDTRTVPIPPELVSVLRKRVEGVTGLVFQTAGRPISDVTCSRRWKEARESVLQDDGTLARIYSLRHLAASTWLNAGVPVVEVASRLGHSPAVCLTVYAHVIVSERGRWNSVIESAIA